MKTLYLFLITIVSLYMGHEAGEAEGMLTFAILFCWGAVGVIVSEMVKQNKDDSTED